MEEDAQRVRLFVGGLGPSVVAEDLERAFGSLGRVTSMELVRSKDRDFAYLDFEASSAAALRKVFSTYKGCKWKGGCLRVEIAKEHYLSRLQREWDAKAAEKDSQREISKPPSRLNAAQELKLLFPRLRRVKSVPLRGTGRHKRSFERWNSQPLGLLKLCECEHHEQDGADPFEYEHDAYLRLVDKLEDGEMKQKGSKNEKTEDKPASAMIAKRKEDDRRKSDQNESAKTRQESEASSKKSVRKDRTTKLSKGAEATSIEAGKSSDDPSKELEATVSKTIKQKPKAQTKWDKLFEVAAGLGEEDIHEETDVDTVEKDEHVSSETETETEEPPSRKRKRVRFTEESVSRKSSKGTSQDETGDGNGSGVQELTKDSSEREGNQTQWLQVSSWTSLVGDGASFSLRGVTVPKVEAAKAPVVWGQAEGATSESSDRKSSGVSKPEVKKSNEVDKKKRSDAASINLKTSSTRSLLENPTCSFMRSSKAEEEWLSSKEKLKTDFMARHKAALRSKRKISSFR